MPKNREMKILIPTTKIQKSVKCKNTKQAYKIFKEILNYEEYELKEQEHLWVMGIDGSGYVVCIYIAAIGAENRAIIDPIDIFSIAIACKSRKVFLAHNHPNVYNNLNMSIEDFELTQKLYYACLPFGIEIIDHIILADGTYYSFKENAYMAIIHASLMYKTYKELKPKLEEEKEKHGMTKMLEGENNKAIEIVKEMLAQNSEIDFIVTVTKLTKEEVLKIKSDMNK